MVNKHMEHPHRTSWLFLLAVTLVSLLLTEAAVTMVTEETCSTGTDSCTCTFGKEVTDGQTHYPKVIIHVLCERKNLSHVPNLTALTEYGYPIVHLSLLGNLIEEIGPEQWSDLKIETIHLEGNHLKRIHPEAFKGMKTFGRLTLNVKNNDLFSLPAGLFIPLMIQGSRSGLQTIKLIAADNPKLHLSADVFQGFESKVEKLDLTGTALQRVPTSLLKSMTGLKFLSLSSNSIEVIGPYHFPKLPFLRVLDLSDNAMEYVDREAFTQLQDLKSLSVDDNNLSSLSFLKGPYFFRNQLQVYATGNSIVCDCELFSLVRAKTIQVFGECAKPSMLKGSYLFDPSPGVAPGKDGPQYRLLEDLGQEICAQRDAPLGRADIRSRLRKMLIEL